MSRLPAELMPVDFFKIIEEEPQLITIKEVSIKEDIKSINTDWLKLKLELVETGQTCTHSWRIGYGKSKSEYYIRMSEDLHPLLAYESGIMNNALTYWDEELIELLTGLSFKATGKTKTYSDGRRFIIIPDTTEGDVING